MTVKKGDRFKDIGGRIWFVRIIAYPSQQSGEMVSEPDRVVLIAEDNEDNELVSIADLKPPLWGKI